MNECVSLRSASVQDIQLELIRRTRFNAMDGEKIHASLMKHRDLWLAALLDQPGSPSRGGPGRLLTAGLIKLRDLPENLWNADTLYVLAPTRAAADRLAQVAEDEEWGGDIVAVADQRKIEDALGATGDDFGLLSVWWD